MDAQSVKTSANVVAETSQGIARLRRPQRTAGRGRDRLAPHGGADLRGPPAAEFLPHAARQDWDKIAKLLKPGCTASTEEAALKRFAEFADIWGKKYPVIVKLWENAWKPP
ncbi:hypothetical protein AQJ11_43385 [Streptomyces corchorusii]|uniref:Mutator family transposase n=1 Tax=Streptomyces corchorusii TaxID=1903 RepID=A0A117Q928_STRCK|nr:hypothetical protein AQJ11_43385 [Streptomyces corchorusii]